jgi:hypothetical protein
MSYQINEVRSLAQLRSAMRNCEQTKGLSVLEHGLQVARYFDDLRNHVINSNPLKYEWRLPEWVYSKDLWKGVLPLEKVREYQIYHDCGKPFCREVDGQGRVHFPDHGKVSSGIWKKMGRCSLVGELIEEDMDIHLMKASGMEEFYKRDTWQTLLLTGLCEVHANAAMFGGIESTSFKIKYKQINKRGKGLMTFLQKSKGVVNG